MYLTHILWNAWIYSTIQRHTYMFKHTHPFFALVGLFFGYKNGWVEQHKGFTLFIFPQTPAIHPCIHPSMRKGLLYISVSLSSPQPNQPNQLLLGSHIFFCLFFLLFVFFSSLSLKFMVALFLFFLHWRRWWRRVVKWYLVHFIGYNGYVFFC